MKKLNAWKGINRPQTNTAKERNARTTGSEESPKNSGTEPQTIKTQVYRAEALKG
jgi:hypothetical protein